LCHQALRNKIYWNTNGFDHLAKDCGQGSGTTCGFLPHRLLWRLGCNDPGLVNRSSPGQGFKWRTGQSLEIFTKHRSSVIVDSRLAKIMAGAKPDSSEKNKGLRDALAKGKRGPQPGDFIIIRGANWWNKATGVRDRDSSHIMVLLDIFKADGKNVEWHVAQTGVGAFSTGYGKILQGGEITTLKAKLFEGDLQEGRNPTTPRRDRISVFNADITGEGADFPRREQRLGEDERGYEATRFAARGEDRHAAHPTAGTPTSVKKMPPQLPPEWTAAQFIGG